jgi:predicted transcriptional regulator
MMISYPPEEVNHLALLDLLRELKGDERSQDDWADELGLSQSVVSLWLIGKGKLGKKGLVKLLARYPEQRERIIREFEAAEGLVEQSA